MMTNVSTSPSDIEGVRILLINWKWAWHDPFKIEEEPLSEKDSTSKEKAVTAIDEPELFKRFFVINEKSNVDYKSIVVSTTIYRQNINHLYHLIDFLFKEYNQPEIYLFLHRWKMFSSDDVTNILSLKTSNNVNKSLIVFYLTEEGIIFTMVFKKEVFWMKLGIFLNKGTTKQEN